MINVFKNSSNSIFYKNWIPLFHDWIYQIFPFCLEETLFISLQTFSTDVNDEEILCGSEMIEYLQNFSLFNLSESQS